MGKLGVLPAEKALVPDVSEIFQARGLYGPLAFFRERQDHRAAADEGAFLFRGDRDRGGPPLPPWLPAGSAVPSFVPGPSFSHALLALLPPPFLSMRRGGVHGRRSGT